MSEYVDLFSEIDAIDIRSRDTYLRAPFPYPGGKSQSVGKILDVLPYRNSYIEPFGGSASIILSRQSSKLEVFNDRYAGVVAFYRCMRDEVKYQKLVELITTTIHSREDFVDCHNQWATETDDVQRAFKWFYATAYSFGGLCRNFGRAIKGVGCLSGKILHPDYLAIHNRFKYIQVENQDWSDCLLDYDNDDAVFYLDPPYLETYSGTYKHEMTRQDHQRMLEIVFNMKGYVAISSYRNGLYDSFDWSDVHSWKSTVSIDGKAILGNRTIETDKRVQSEEVLYVKE
jgi:DNA adenine methylase